MGSTTNLNNESETKKNEPEQLPLSPIKSPPAHREAASRQVTEQINRRRRRCRRYTAWSPRREGEGCRRRDVSERNGTRPLGYPAMWTREMGMWAREMGEPRDPSDTRRDFQNTNSSSGTHALARQRKGTSLSTNTSAPSPPSPDERSKKSCAANKRNTRATDSNSDILYLARELNKLA